MASSEAHEIESPPRRILIAGASGVIGLAALEHFGRLPGWDAVGLSRRQPHHEGGRHLSIDLLDPAACASALQDIGPVSHLVYCALQENPGLLSGWTDAELMQTNRRMLENLLAGLARSAQTGRGTGLEHVSLLQGTKAYGAHLHTMRVPGRESEPRDPHENFYWLHEDLLRERAARDGFRFTIWRPPVVFGHAFGSPMNPMAAIGTLASIAKADGEALHWPGGQTGPSDGVDARLLARAFEWAADSPHAQDEVFNISNGDVFTWENLWEATARAMEMELGEPRPERVSQTMPRRAAAWERLVARHGLRAPGLKDFVGDSFLYLEMFSQFGRDRPAPPSLLSTIKLRQAGFHDCIDTERMLGEWLAWMRSRQILPPL